MSHFDGKDLVPLNTSQKVRDNENSQPLEMYNISILNFETSYHFTKCSKK